ncbi:glycosyl hydrolase 115 family protein [Dysgonomonas sp. 37-18]|uniref:glycosyl hydrolase 115 family protein n=1 Tax=Dysgonomonas sp. 37-18 TaxID=1895907 RepID=UPI000B289A88|nr:glycosyl hydrolase 115 family protein [Dysgonomonas sp. 37-18]
MSNRVSILFLFTVFFVFETINAQIIDIDEAYSLPQYIQNERSENSFEIVANGKSAKIYVDPDDWKGVIIATNNLSNDIYKVSGTSSLVISRTSSEKGSILIGTIGKSRIIDQLIAEKKIDVSGICGKWESFLIATVDGNLVVAGSDKRGTIFGIYDISEKIGVSPWYWWTDAPIRKNSKLYVKAGRYVQPSPKVKYRGIFINDEEPSFGGWARSNFGGINSKMYVHMFELLLRLKANYLWPAMWGKSFNEDDPMNPVLADEYGIVMGTSHHEPMMRSHKEYTSRKDEVGPWDYSTNKEKLDKFFLEGIERNKEYDNLVTIGMRGDGDVAMSEGGDEENMKILHRVIDGQREILTNVYGKHPSEIPQTWAIFTEVQRYYDAGFSVPDDVLLMFCDNNWGYIRRIAPPHERGKAGGCGLYYHIDMNGGPWNDRWINTTTIPKLREQFNLAYKSGLDALWVVNVGDLKPKELPIDFIMRYAWNPDAIPADKVQDYTVNWAENIFGKEYAEDIADIVSKYAKYNLWRKPEVQATTIFSHVNYHEADRVLKLWHDIVAKAEAIQQKIPKEAQDAYYQLVLYPTKASAGVAEIYLAAGKNNLYSRQGRTSANDYAARARELFKIDEELSDYYNEKIANGKWKDMMLDKHIGYEKWFMPKENKLPDLIEVKALGNPTMGVAVEGSEEAWSKAIGKVKLPVFDFLNDKSYYIDIFNKGVGTFDFTAKADKPWIKLSNNKGKVNKDFRLQVEIDWNLLPNGKADGIINVKQGKITIPVEVSAIKSSMPDTKENYFGGFIGEFTIPANKYNANISGRDAEWITLPDLGRGEACMGIYPVTAPSVTPEKAPVLEYKIYLPKSRKTTVCLGILPTQDVYPQRGLRIAAALDDQTPLILDARKGLVDTFGEYNKENLAKSTVLKPLPPVNRDLALISHNKHFRNEIFDNIRWLDVEFDVDEPGIHTLKVFMVDPEVVLEKIIVNPDNQYPSYFGAIPKSF